MKTTINLLFPHQLFKSNSLLENGFPIYLVEEYLFFKQYRFHQQKIAYHRATMQFYKDYLIEQKIEVHYVEATQEIADIRQLIPYLKEKGVQTIHYLDPTDNWLSKRLQAGAEKTGIQLVQYDNPLFLNTVPDLAAFFKDKKKFFHTKFYIHQRQQRNILLDAAGKPLGGKWSHDADNRKKYPRGKTPPAVQFPKTNLYYEEALVYTQKYFSAHYGTLSDQPFYPITYEDSRLWLQQFLEIRFWEFGPYEDAIVAEASILNHSVLTPMLNIGLLTPQEIIDTTLAYAEKEAVPLNSVEGFIRQIIGWREFIRALYELKGTEERTKNYWGFNRKIPASFWNGTTGIPPIDQTIKKVLQTGYAHHIERLMVLGNFMLLCEFDPDEVYRWFMELFIDAYDWVMVPNVYGMSQFADGGLMATKPYISGSNYLKKMSNFKKGDWQMTWDALFWRFMNVHRDFFLKNPRLGMLVRMYDKMPAEKQERLMATADAYLEELK